LRLPESRRGKLIALAALVAGAIVIFLLYRRFFPDFDPQALLDDFANLLGDWTYVIVGLMAFLEAGAFVGLLVPGETTMTIGGAVAGLGVINLYLLIAVAWLMAFLGDSFSFMLGRKLGRNFVLDHGPKVRITRERFERVEDYFDKHGGKTILIGRFVGIVRSLAPFVAGTSGMSYRGFVPYSVLGAGLQVTSNIMLGYVFARSIDSAAEYSGVAALILGTLIVTTVTAVVAVRFFRVAENRSKTVRRMESHRLTRPLVDIARKLRPQIQFLLVDRLTPGGKFGLEFTTLAAILAVSSFGFIAFAVVFSDNPAATPGDLEAFDIVGLIRTDWLIAFSKAFTWLGSSVVVGPLAAITAAVLAFNRRWADFWVLVFSALAIVIGVDFFKDAVARPRPEGGLVEVSSLSYPSAHAAYSVFYTWLAVTVAVRIRPDMTRSTALVLAGLVMTALVGLSRVFLGVHYLSDVTGGWAMGAFFFAYFAAVALVITQLRKN
jgi:membrane protein DedA with SNARE-associated domain/membrane-associated phospholipid phosphatase